MTGKVSIAAVCGLGLALSASSAAAVPVTVTINQIDIDDVDHNHDPASTLYQYMVSQAFFDGGHLPVDAVPHVGVCAVRIPADNGAGCQNRITPNPGDWSFTRDVDPALGPINVLITVRNADAVIGLHPIDLTPGFLAPNERGLSLIVDAASGTWRVRNDTAVNPTTAQSTVFATTHQDVNLLAGRVHFTVSFCGGAACFNGSQMACEGTPCTTGGTDPVCGGIPGTVSCATGTYACIATPLDVPEDQNGRDDDCDGRVDECNASQIGQTFACTAAVGICPSVSGSRTCTTAEAPPGACVPVGSGDPNVCQVDCATTINVGTVAELREAVAQAHLTECKDVIVLAPGFYDLDSPLLINDSMEIRGVGTSFGCEGVDLESKLLANQLDHNLGSLRCDGDNGEDPGATVIRNVAQLPGGTGEGHLRVIVIGLASCTGTSTASCTGRQEVTLRHLTISGGITNTVGTTSAPGAGILAVGPTRLKLFNVVVEDNVARGPGAGIVHEGASWDYPVAPTFVMVNSTVRRNRSTTPPQGTGGSGLGLQGNGGGIRVSGVAFILRSTINDNASIRGAGILAFGALHVYNSTITRNIAGQGGAGILIWALPGQETFLELRNNTITNNLGQWFAEQPDVRKDGAGVLALGAINSGGALTRVEAFGNIIADNMECRDLVTAGPNGANCSGEEGGSFVTLGSNVGSSDCAFSPTVSLPGSGAVQGDRVVRLGYPRDPMDPTFRRIPDPFYDAFTAVCDIGRDVTANGNPLGSAQLAAQAAMPSSNREIYDFAAGQHLRLVGDLADQGGPTQTMALPEGSPAILVGASSDNPGFVSDEFPSSTPLCPSTDQRLFALAGAGAPLTCDAGAYQTLATAALSVETAQTQLSALFPDRDGDGIADVIDGDPALASLAFSDASSGGRMSGAIQTRGDQSLWLYDGFPNPQAGVVALALSSGGPTPARIIACDGCVNFSVAAGEIKQVDCPAGCVIADAGPDQIRECAAAGHATAQLDARASRDTGGAPVSFLWSAPGITFSNPALATPTASFPLGTTTATVTVSSTASSPASDSVQITVVDTTPPVITVPADVTITSCTNANIGTATATDACQGSVPVSNNKPTKFPLGTTTVTYTAVDAFGNTATRTQRVTAVLGDNASCCPAGTTIRTGTPSNDTLTGTSGSDCILGLGGQDTINGMGGNDYISGGEGDDIIDGGSGNDRVYGGNGQDQLRGGIGADFIDAGAGDDRCWGGDQDDVILGGSGQDQLYGEAGNDQLSGDDGDDRLEGGDGNDALNGGGLHDTCLGGPGTDTFALCEVATQ